MPEPGILPDRDSLATALWPSDAPARTSTWVILDGARDTRIYGAVERSLRDKACLFAGPLSSELKAAAPHLVRLEPEDRLARVIIDSGWGKAWGIFLRTDAPLETLRRHLRRFLRVSDEAGRKLLFRYYDPRVLGIYLPTCTPEELATVFGPIDWFALESEEGSRLAEYRFTGSNLRVTYKDLKPLSA